MGKLIEGEFLSKEELERIRNLPDPLEGITEEENKFLDYWITGKLDLPEENILQKRYIENKRKEYDKEIERIQKGLQEENNREN